MLVNLDRTPVLAWAALARDDAIFWPFVWVVSVRHLPEPVGLVGPFVIAVAVLCALGRLHRALWVNTVTGSPWRWARIAAALMLMGVVLKLTVVGWVY